MPLTYTVIIFNDHMIVSDRVSRKMLQSILMTVVDSKGFQLNPIWKFLEILQCMEDALKLKLLKGRATPFFLQFLAALLGGSVTILANLFQQVLVNQLQWLVVPLLPSHTSLNSFFFAHALLYHAKLEVHQQEDQDINVSNKHYCKPQYK